MADDLDPMTKLFIEACADLLVMTEERDKLRDKCKHLESEVARLERASNG
jgi:hypothetical protein